MKVFLAFVAQVVDKAFEEKQTDVATLMSGELEKAREALIQKIGENISVRRVQLAEGGIVGAYTHSNKRIAVLVQLSAGSVELAKDIGMHIAAINPQVVKPEDMPKDVLDKEEAIIKAQPDMEGKPDNIVEKMMVGRIKRFLKENSLTEQEFVKDPELTVGQLVAKANADIQHFVRYEVGEGIEQKK